MLLKEWPLPVKTHIDLSRPFNLYKYCDLNTASLIVANGTLKFTHPWDFNDPFDCDIDLLHFDIKEAAGKALDDIITLKRRFPTASDEILTKGFRENQMNKIKKCSVTCFSLSAYNTLMWR